MTAPNPNENRVEGEGDDGEDDNCYYSIHRRGRKGEEGKREFLGFHLFSLFLPFSSSAFKDYFPTTWL
jgi:hypothetical protein